MHFTQMFFFLSFSAIVLGAPRPSENDIDAACAKIVDGTTGWVNKRGGADADQWYSTGC